MSGEPGTVDGPSPAGLGSHRLSVQISPSDVSIGASSAESVTWGDLKVQWENYVCEKMDERLVFEDTREDEFLAAQYSHRFTTEYSKMTYARIKDFERGMFAEYDDPTLVFLTMTTSTTTSTGRPRCPFGVLDEIVDSWSDGVRYELSKSMGAERKKDTYHGFGGDEWEYLRILEPTTENGYGPSGYPHQHVVVVVDGDVTQERFESVIDKHLEKAPNALGRAHEFDTTIEMMDGGELTNVGAYIFKYLGKTYETGELEEYEERFNALLWETGRRRIQPSDGAQKWMQREDEEAVESDRFRFVGVGDIGRVEELQEYDSAETFRVDKEMGARAFLSGREGVGVEIDRETNDCTHETVHQGQCIKCGVHVQDLVAGGPPPD